MIVLVQDYTVFEILGGTRDDAAGEAFDKVARVLGAGYPGGPRIDSMAQGGNPHGYKLPVSHVKDSLMDFSFSGLRTSGYQSGARRQAKKGQNVERTGSCGVILSGGCRYSRPKTCTCHRADGCAKCEFVQAAWQQIHGCAKHSQVWRRKSGSLCFCRPCPFAEIMQR